MKVSVSSLSLAALLVVSASNYVLAQACTINGTDITCAGTEGFDGDTDGNTVNITNAANIVEAGDAIELGDNNTVTNEGRVESTGDDGIDVESNNTVTNNGTVVTSGGTGDHAFQINDDNTVVNNGIINSSGDGIGQTFGHSDRNTVTNSSTGTITAAEEGILLRNDNDITNAGTINATNGIYFRNGGSVLNSGTINSTEDGLFQEFDEASGTTITNSGTIDAGDDGMNLQDGNTIINTASGVIEADDEGVEIDDDNTFTNNGKIDAGDHGIELDNDNTITNNGTIEAGGMGIFADVSNPGDEDGDGNTIVNNGTIDSEGRGIQVNDDNTITNNGTIDSGDNDGINGNNDNVVKNSGTIIAGDDGIRVENNGEVTNNGSISAVEDGIEALLNADIENNGSISSQGIGVDFVTGQLTNTGSIDAAAAGVVIQSSGNTPPPVRVVNDGSITGTFGIQSLGNNSKTVNVVNRGTITGTTNAAIRFSNGDNSLFNNGRIVGGNGTAVLFNGGADLFSWRQQSEVVGEVDMGTGNDTLRVLGANVIGATTFRSVENVIITPGSSAIFDTTAIPGPRNGVLYTGSSDVLATTGAMAGNMAHDLTRRLLNSEGGVTQPVATAQGALGAGNWWVFGNATFQDDRGQGFTQEAQNITVGRSFGNFDVFFGLENASAELSANTQSVDQQLVYLGASTSFDIAENLELVGLAILGATEADYNTGLGTSEGDGSFGAISARMNYSTEGFVLGAYAGYARLNTDPLTTGAITFASQSSDTVFGGVDLRMPTIEYANGASLSPMIGVGLQNGSTDAVTMSAGGLTTSIAGTDSQQRFVTTGFDLTKGNTTTSLRFRADTGAYLTVDLGVRIDF